MSDTPLIRVLIVDDHEMVRQGLMAFLNVVEDMIAVGQASNGVEAVKLCGELNPDVVLMDLVLPQMTGVEAAAEIRAKYPETQIIALTSFTDNNDLMRDALQAGVIGYLFKDASINDLARAIRNAFNREPTLSPGATRMLMQSTSQPARRDFQLTERELEVLALMAKGLSNRQVAQHLSISWSTAKFHVSSILSKLSAKSRTEAVSIAHEHHLVT